MLNNFFVLISVWFLAACASLGPFSKDGEEVKLRLSAEPGKSAETRYYSTSRILTYTDKQLVKDRTETVDFTVLNQFQKVDEKTGTLHFTSTTTRKDGMVPLHDLAFPEKDEVIDYVIKNTGEIIKAGRFPAQSIFFVPSVPIPDDPVKVGDTWTLEHVWRSSRDGVPLKLEIAAILKDLVTCEKNKKCADIEISGHVNLVIPPDRARASFASRVWGRMLFSLERGDVLWTQTRSREEMVSAQDRITVNSCMVSELKAGANFKTQLECEPKEEAVTKVPAL